MFDPRMKMFLICLSVIVLSAILQRSSFSTDASAAQAEYDSLLQQLVLGDTTVDYGALRHLFTRTKGYSPYDVGLDDLRYRLRTSFRARDWVLAGAQSDSVLSRCFVDFNAHYVAAVCANRMGDVERYKFHTSSTSSWPPSPSPVSQVLVSQQLSSNS